MSEHVESLRNYTLIILALMVLTVLTVAAAYVDLGFLNTVVAIAIATVKALLVVAFFMHLRFSARILWLVAGSSVFFVLLLLVLLLSDYRTRNWMSRPQPWETPVPVPAPAAQGFPATHG